MAIGVFCNEGDNFEELMKMAYEELEREAIEEAIEEENEQCFKKGYDN